MEGARISAVTGPGGKRYPDAALQVTKEEQFRNFEDNQPLRRILHAPEIIDDFFVFSFFFFRERTDRPFTNFPENFFKRFPDKCFYSDLCIA
jgi:hypothetical protein